MNKGTKANRHERTQWEARGIQPRVSSTCAPFPLVSSCLRALSAPALVLALSACTDNHNSPTTRPLTMEEKQQQLLTDPFGYKSETGKTDITGGDLTHFDKDAFKKDVDNALNP